MYRDVTTHLNKYKFRQEVKKCVFLFQMFFQYKSHEGKEFWTGIDSDDDPSLLGSIHIIKQF